MPIPMNIKPYCTCHATGQFLRQDGYRLDPPSGLWVHGRCNKPSQLNYERVRGGMPQLRVQVKEVDYIELERQQEANAIITEELGWSVNEPDLDWDE